MLEIIYAKCNIKRKCNTAYTPNAIHLMYVLLHFWLTVRLVSYNIWFKFIITIMMEITFGVRFNRFTVEITL